MFLLSALLYSCALQIHLNLLFVLDSIGHTIIKITISKHYLVTNKDGIDQHAGAFMVCLSILEVDLYLTTVHDNKIVEVLLSAS